MPSTLRRIMDVIKWSSLKDDCTKPLRGSTIKIRFLLNFNFRCTECVYDLILYNGLKLIW